MEVNNEEMVPTIDGDMTYQTDPAPKRLQTDDVIVMSRTLGDPNGNIKGIPTAVHQQAIVFPDDAGIDENESMAARYLRLEK